MDAFDINKRLIRLYGRDTAVDLPKWRLVRSESQTEKRTGNYNLFYGDIFIRNETGTREVMKYHYIKPCWVLEKLMIANNDNDYNLLGQRKYSYEPLYVFLDKNNKKLPLAWRPVELVIYMINEASKPFLTEQDHLDLEAKKIIKEQEKTKEVLFGNETVIGDALAYKQGVVVPNSYSGVEDAK